MWTMLGNNAVIDGDLAKAQGYYEECQRLCEQMGNPLAFALLRGNLGHLSNKLGDFKGEYEHMRASLSTFFALNDMRNLAGSVANSASGFWVAGDFETAATTLGCGYGIWERSDCAPDIVDAVFADQWRSRLIEAMGEDAFLVAFERGKTVPIKDMIATLLAVPKPWETGPTLHD
jgi:hypothetical protein